MSCSQGCQVGFQPLKKLSECWPSLDRSPGLDRSPASPSGQRWLAWFAVQGEADRHDGVLFCVEGSPRGSSGSLVLHQALPDREMFGSTSRLRWSHIGMTGVCVWQSLRASPGRTSSRRFLGSAEPGEKSPSQQRLWSSILKWTFHSGELRQFLE